MNRSPKERLIACGLLAAYLASLAVAGWGSYRVIEAFAEQARRFDNEAQDFRRAFIESTTMALREGPKSQRLEIIRYLGASGSQTAVFLDALREACDDDDPEIAAAARNAVAALNAGPK
jgi:hypothetical protein